MGLKFLLENNSDKEPINRINLIVEILWAFVYLNYAAQAL